MDSGTNSAQKPPAPAKASKPEGGHATKVALNVGISALVFALISFLIILALGGFVVWGIVSGSFNQWVQDIINGQVPPLEDPNREHERGLAYS